MDTSKSSSSELESESESSDISSESSSSETALTGFLGMGFELGPGYNMYISWLKPLKWHGTHFLHNAWFLWRRRGHFYFYFCCSNFFLFLRGNVAGYQLIKTLQMCKIMFLPNCCWMIVELRMWGTGVIAKSNYSRHLNCSRPRCDFCLDVGTWTTLWWCTPPR